MFCPVCANEVAQDRSFCGKCGARLHAAAVTPAPQGAGSSVPDDVLPASSGHRLLYSLVVLLVVLGGAAWWWFQRPAPAYKAHDPGIYPFQGMSADGKAGKTGFIDAEGNVLIQPQWDDLGGGAIFSQPVAFNEGLCAVQKDAKYGYIDTKGNLVIPLQFDSAGPFVEGLARVKLGSAYGYIDKSGHYAINPQFSEAGNFHDGLAAVHTDEGWAFIRKSGKYAIRPRFESADSNGFSDGRAAVCPNKCGFIGRNGMLIIKPQFDSVSAFSEGLAAVQIGEKWGYINTDGKIVINPQFDAITTFSGGLAAVSVSGNTGTIDKNGKYVVNPGQFNMQLTRGDIQPVTSTDGVGLMSRDGKWVLKPTKALSSVSMNLGKVFYGEISGQATPISISGKVLSGPFKNAMIDTLAQDVGNEANAIQSMHTLVSAESTYSNNYPTQGFTAALDKLGPATGTPDQNHAGLIEADLAAGAKEGYQFTVNIPEGTSTGGANFNFFLVGKPAAGHAGRTFCADSTQAIHFAAQGEDCTLSSATL
jgi:hypothetical protein